MKFYDAASNLLHNYYTMAYSASGTNTYGFRWYIALFLYNIDRCIKESWPSRSHFYFHTSTSSCIVRLGYKC